MDLRLAPCTRRALRALGPILGLVLGLTLGSAATAAAGDDEDPPPADGRTSSEILSVLLAQRDLADATLYEVLGHRKNSEALGALELATDAVQTHRKIDAVYHAFRHFRDVRGLEDVALEFLLAETEDPYPHKPRAAARTLLAFRGAALDELRAVADGHADPVCRQIAIGGLVPMLHAQRTPEALETLLQGYRVPHSGTYELGVDTLAVFDGPECTQVFEDALEDRDLPARTKAMALEALGRIGGDAARELVGEALRSKHAMVQVAALRALGGLGIDEHLRRVERLERDRDPSVRHEALLVQAATRAGEPEWREHVLRVSGGRDFALRTAAATCLVVFDDDEARQALYGLLSDDEVLVRRAAVRATVTLRREDVLPLLVERIGLESLRMREELRDGLELLTGMDLGLSPERWQRWWSEQGSGYRLPSRDEALALVGRRDRSREAGRTQTQFYGIPIASDRVCFVLDVSGSMSEPSYDGGMRIDSVKEELLGAVRGLPDGAWFNLLFFDTSVYGWKKKLVPMNRKARGAALEYARKQGPGGGTALYDALVEAFSDPTVDTIVLLSDGEPTEGRVTDPQEIVERVEGMNALRDVVIHTVSVNWSSDLLRELAQRSGGSYQEVR